MEHTSFFHASTFLGIPMPTLEEIAEKQILISVVESQDYSNRMKGNIVKFGPSGYSPNICKYDVTHVTMSSGVNVWRYDCVPY